VGKVPYSSRARRPEYLIMKCNECKVSVLCDLHYEMWRDLQALMKKALDSDQVALESRSRLEDIINIDVCSLSEIDLVTPAILLLVMGWDRFVGLCKACANVNLEEKHIFIEACHKVVQEFDQSLTEEDRKELALHGDKFDLIPLIDSLITPQVEASTIRFYIDAVNVFSAK